MKKVKPSIVKSKAFSSERAFFISREAQAKTAQTMDRLMTPSVARKLVKLMLMNSRIHSLKA